MNKLKDLIDKKLKSSNKKTKMDLCIEIALIHSENNDHKEAFEEYSDLLQLAQENNNLLMITKAHRQMGECLLDLQRPSDAMRHIDHYLEAAKKLRDLFEIQRAYVTIGRCHLDIATNTRNPVPRRAATSKAENAFLKSIQICQQLSMQPLSDKKGAQTAREIADMRTVSLFNLGLVVRESIGTRIDKRSIEVAERYFRECSVLSAKHGLLEMQQRSLFELADARFSRAISGPKVDISGVQEAMKIARGARMDLATHGRHLRCQFGALEAQCCVVAGLFTKAYKRFRMLSKHCPSSERKDYEVKMTTVINLKKKLESYKAQKSSLEEHISIGKMYEELDVPQLAVKYYKLSLEKLNNKSCERYMKLTNRILSLNQVIGLYEENIPLLEDKLKHQMRANEIDKVTATLCSRTTEILLDNFLRSGKAAEDLDKSIRLTQQLDSLAFVSEKLSLQISATETIIKFLEELCASQNSQAVKKEIVKAQSKLDRLTPLSRKSIKSEESDSDTASEPELSDLEQSDNEIDEVISSDSDIDISSLTEGQIEELEAVGKRIRPDKRDSFIKRNEKGETLLHTAAIVGNLKQVMKLVNQMKHPLDIVDSAGWTPLHDAANHGRTKIVEFLLDQGANIEHTGPSIDCSTPLMEAVHGANIDTAMLLIERGANLWHKNKLGENVGDCVYDWKQRCISENCYDEPKARLFKRITDFIKQKLGDRYIEWCRQRRGERAPDCMIDSLQSKTNLQKQKKVFKPSNRRLMDDEEEESDQEGTTSETTTPVQDYRSTINSLKGRSKKISKTQRSSDSNVESGTEAGYVIGDDWLEDDMGKCSKKQTAKEPDYGGYIRGPKKRESQNVNNDENVQCSTPKRRRRSSKSDATNQSSQESSGRFDIRSSLVSTDIVPIDETKFSQPDDLFDPEPTTSTQLSDSSLISASSVSIPKSVTVVYKTVPMKIPVDPGCDVEWLIKETTRRYSILYPEGCVGEASNIRISTEDGCIYLAFDSLDRLLADLAPGPIKFFANDITPSGFSIKFQHLNRSLQSSLLTHRLDLANQNLSKDLPDFLCNCHFGSQLNSLTRISLQDNNITDEIINKPFDNEFGHLDFAKFLLHHSHSLEELDLSRNRITGSGFSNLLYALKGKGLPKLKVLNLSFNPIGLNDFCVLSLIMKPILSMFSSIKILKLNNCEISNFSEFSSIRSASQDKVNVLSELDLSNNPLICKKENSHLQFWKMVEDSLRHLSISGCGKLLMQLDENNSLLMELFASFVEPIASGQLKLTSLDVSDCCLDKDSLNHLNRLFISENCTVSFIKCHSNDILKDSDSWLSFMHSLGQPRCKVIELSIDLPHIDCFEDYQICAYTARTKIQTKFSVALCGIHLKTSSKIINYIRCRMFEEETIDLSDETVRLSDNVDMEIGQRDHYSQYLALSILQDFKNQYGNKNVNMQFEDDFMKISNCNVE